MNCNVCGAKLGELEDPNICNLCADKEATNNPLEILYQGLKNNPVPTPPQTPSELDKAVEIAENDYDHSVMEHHQICILSRDVIEQLIFAAKRLKEVEKELQLRADLKQCAEDLIKAQRNYRIQYAHNIGGLHNMETPYDKALSLPSVQAALKKDK